jgi:phage tail sheath protein FI
VNSIQPSIPGIRIEQQPIYMTEPEMATAVPVFIGYTEKGEVGQLHKVHALADYEKQFLNPPDPDSRKAACGYLYDALKHYFDVGGEPCFVLPVGQRKPNDAIDNQQIGATLKKAASSDVFAKEPTLTLMAAPDLALLDAELEREPAKGEVSQQWVKQWADIWEAMLSTAQKNDLFCLLDAPASADTARSLLTSCSALDNCAEYGAAYWPRLLVSEGEHEDLSKYLPPSAAVAAMVQRVDRERGIWKAPANVPLPQVITPEYDHWQAQDLFNANDRSINVIRGFAGRGVRVWGCRTLAPGAHPQRRYVQTHRLLSYIKTHLKEIARFVTFEPNNEITWIKLKSLTQTWLRQLWFRGGLFGATEDDAFRVFIGLDETMTQADIQAGRLIMRVCVAPSYPAEFIDISLQFYTSESHVTQNAAPQDRRISA